MSQRSHCGTAADHQFDDIDVAYVSEVREICRQAGRPDLATGYLERGATIASVIDDMTEVAIGFRSPRSKARSIAPFLDLFDDDGAWMVEGTE